MIVSADPNSPNWVVKWGSVKITIDGEEVKPENCCYAESGASGKVHLYERTKKGQILTLKNQPRVTEFLGKVDITVGNNAGCKACTRNSFKRKDWWRLMHHQK